MQPPGSGEEPVKRGVGISCRTRARKEVQGSARTHRSRVDARRVLGAAASLVTRVVSRADHDSHDSRAATSTTTTERRAARRPRRIPARSTHDSTARRSPIRRRTDATSITRVATRRSSGGGSVGRRTAISTRAGSIRVTAAGSGTTVGPRGRRSKEHRRRRRHEQDTSATAS